VINSSRDRRLGGFLHSRADPENVDFYLRDTSGKGRSGWIGITCRCMNEGHGDYGEVDAGIQSALNGFVGAEAGRMIWALRLRLLRMMLNEMGIEIRDEGEKNMSEVDVRKE